MQFFTLIPMPPQAAAQIEMKKQFIAFSKCETVIHLNHRFLMI